MKPPSFDGVAMSVLIKTALEPLGDVDQRGKSGLGECPARVGRPAADTTDDKHLAGWNRDRLHLVNEMRIWTAILIGESRKNDLFANRRQIRNASKMPLRRRSAVNKDRIVAFAKFGPAFGGREFFKHRFPFIRCSGNLMPDGLDAGQIHPRCRRRGIGSKGKDHD